MRNRARFLLVLAAQLFAASASAVTIAWVPVGDPGNAATSFSSRCFAPNCGSVSYSYYIGKYEVTNAQYAEFLNAKAASDPLNLYDTFMRSDATAGGILQSGASGSYTYTVKGGFANKPVTYVTFYDVLRFTNWLNNGQGSASTETGAYTLLGGTATPSNGTTVTRNVGATIFLTSENEWYKAAYYNSAGGNYFDYPTRTNTPGTSCVAPESDTGNSANCFFDVMRGPTDVGAYTLSGGPYGTFDQGGNVLEYNEQIVSSTRGLRGGDWSNSGHLLAASFRSNGGPTVGTGNVGFRVASLVPEPGTGLLVMTGLLGLAARRKRRA